MQTRPTVALATKNGAPLCAELKIRESTTMPGRLKVVLTVATDEGLAALTPNGLEPLNIPGIEDANEVSLGPEARLEMN